METNKQLGNKAASSFFWKLFERFGAQIIQFIISIILARLLLPEDYGALALLTVFISLSNVFTQSGFSYGLIRKIDADDLDYSSVFWCSFIMSLFIYIVLFFTAPFIANFYEMPILKDVLRVLALVVIISTYNGVQNAILSKKLMFKKLFISSFSSVFLSGIIGVVCAYQGLGIWALAIQQLFSVIITTIVMSFTVKWHPKFIFSFSRVKSLFSFGWKLLVSALLESVFNNLYSLIIGKWYTSKDLAFWNKGKSFPDLLVTNINGSIGSVMYPIYSLQQDNLIELKKMVRKSIQISSYIVFPMMVGLIVIAEPLVKLLLTDKWLFCVPFLQGWCIIYAFMPIHTSNLQVYTALGRSDVFLWLEIIKKILGVVVLIITLPYGLNVMIIGKIVVAILCTFINAVPNIKILHYGIKEQMIDLLPMILMSVAMGGFVYLSSLIPIHYVATMVIEILVGVISYLVMSLVFKPQAFLLCKAYIINIIKSKKKQRACETIVSEESNFADKNGEIISNKQDKEDKEKTEDE